MRHRVGSYSISAQRVSHGAKLISLCAAYVSQRTGWWLLIAGMALLTVAAGPTLTQASSISFAQFSEKSPGGNVFAYHDNGSASDAEFGTSTGGALGALIPVNFTYLTVNGTLPADLTGVLTANLSMTSSTTKPVSVLGGIVGTQAIDGSGAITTDTISFTLPSPAAEGNGTRTNLLTVTFKGQLLGVLGAGTPQLSADSVVAGNTVTYSSDFLSFNTNLERDFSLTFSSWANSGNGNGLSLSNLANDVFFAAASASGAGTFDGTGTFVPEPATWLLGIIGAAMLALTARHLGQRRKALAKCPVKAE
jgi:hypothetical protein